MSEQYYGYQFQWGARCNIEQYRMLKRCLGQKNITEWNEWRLAHRNEEIWLSGTDLADTCLKGVYLWGAHLEGAHLSGAQLEGAVLGGAHLEGAHLDGAHLKGAHLQKAHLEGAGIAGAHLEAAFLREARVEGARLMGAHLQGADLTLAHLEGAVLTEAHLEGANLSYAHLEGTMLRRVHLEAASLIDTHLQGANFSVAMVNPKTLIWSRDVDKHTNFIGVGLDSARVEPGSKQTLKYNIRRKRWETWYPEHRCVGPAVKLFWLMSDYGRSTWRIIASFLVLAVVFAGTYYASALLWPPGIVTDLLEGKCGPTPCWLVPIRALYFSFVTMTTLGFGDMHANSQSLLGHVLLTFQVILGYVLLGALVTRFAVLFTAGGPAQRFTKRPKEEQKAP